MSFYVSASSTGSDIDAVFNVDKTDRVLDQIELYEFSKQKSFSEDSKVFLAIKN